MPGGHEQTLRPFLWRAETLYEDTEVVSRTHDGIERYTYDEYSDRTAQLAHALTEGGIEEGDRVATFCWNHHRHFETYFAVPTIGAQLHTINPLLPDEHIRFIVQNAEDRTIFVDHSLFGKLAGALADADDEFDSVDRLVTMGEGVPEGAADLPIDVVAYEAFIDGHPTEYNWPDVDEDQPAGMCYTSGTTGMPKGVEYTHKMLWSHTMATLTPQGIPMADDDVVMPVVPMFHVNAWGMPFTATAGGAKHVYPGPSPEPEDIASLIEEEGVTVTAGVPTVWMGLQDYMEDNEVDLSTLDTVIVGGSAAPEAMIRWFDDHDVELLHAWGMTEMSPIGSVSHLKSDLEDADYETQLDRRAKQGLTVPGIEFKVVDDDGNEVPHDGDAFGELHVRGPWVTKEYFQRPEANEEDFEDGWLQTGDIVTDRSRSSSPVRRPTSRPSTGRYSTCCARTTPSGGSPTTWSTSTRCQRPRRASSRRRTSATSTPTSRSAARSRRRQRPARATTEAAPPVTDGAGHRTPLPCGSCCSRSNGGTYGTQPAGREPDSRTRPRHQGRGSRVRPGAYRP